MNAAVIGRVDGEFARVEPTKRVREEDGVELAEQVDVTDVRRTPDGLDINAGRAAAQTLRERESVNLDNGAIEIETVEEPTTRYTDFFAVPGELVGVAGSRGTFLFDLLASETGATVERCSFDLDGFAAAFPDATPWKVGFYGHEGPAENGVVHGEHVLEDGVFGDALQDRKKNQLGLTVDHEGREFKMSITRSGYVEVYRPGDLDLAEFVAFVRDEVVPHAE